MKTFFPFLMIFFFWASKNLEAKIIYVNANVAGGAQDGSSWQDAYPLLQSALLLSEYGDSIWVASGTYHPTTGTSRYVSFILKNGVKLYGGFAGTETALDQRDWELNATILSGDIGVPDDSTDNSYTVVYCEYVDSTTVLDGFIITGGNADNPSTFIPSTDRTKSGGGLYLKGSSQMEDARPVIINCKFIRNNAISNGGGLFMQSTSSGAATPLLMGCIFEENYARSGGGVYKSGSSMNHDMLIVNCSFLKNNTSIRGGGFCYISDYGSRNLFFRDCQFISNYSLDEGGGIFHERNDPVSQIYVKRCNFKNNEVELDIGAIGVYNFWFPPSKFSLTIDSCHFESNSKIAIVVAGDSVQISNSSFFLNGLCVAIVAGSKLTVDSCVFQINDGCLNGFTDEDVVVTNCQFIANTAQFEGGACFNGMRTLKVENCYFENNIDESLSNNLIGGGVLFAETNFYGEFTKCKFISNSSSNRGGCFYNRGVLKISDCSFVGNYTEGEGGVFYDKDGKGVLVNNCLFDGNYSDGRGGVFYSDFPQNTWRITNCTFTKNESPLGSILYSENSNFLEDEIYFINCILWGNNFGSDTNQIILNLADSIGVAFSNSLIDVSDCASIASGPITCGPNTLFNVDPMFLDTAGGDFRLHTCSPARDAGDNSIIDSLGLMTDLAGMPRIRGGVVDMGAYESPAFSIHTDSIEAVPCQGSPGKVWLELDTGCPPFFIANGTDTTISDTSRIQLPLPAGTHTLVITDGRMDSDTLQITLPDAPPLEATLSSTDVLCPGSGGTATISALGNTGPYTYLWSSGDTSATATGLSAGVYSVTLTDAQGCTLTDSVEIGSSGHLTLGISIQPISCHDSGDGVAAISPQDGTGPYTWLWNDGRTDSLRTDLAGGQYSVTVTDALGCTDELSFFLPAPDSLVASATATGTSCAGSNTGSATATATGGTKPYSYFWSNSSSFQTISNLAPGWYSVTVTDIKGCQDTASVYVDTAPALSLSIAGATVVCPGDSTALAAQAGGGTPPYTYQWNTGSQDSSIMAGKGSYKVTLTDANGCSQTASQVVSEDPPIELLYEVKPVTHPNQPNGAVEVQLTFGGTPPYSYQWSHGPTTASVDSLSAGEYTLTVTDALGCTDTFTFEVLLTATRNPAAASLQALIVPNPSGSAGAVLHLRGPWPLRLRLSLHDGAGRLLWQQEVLRSEEIDLPKESLPPGTYWLVLRSETGEVLQGLKWSRW